MIRLQSERTQHCPLLQPESRQKAIYICQDLFINGFRVSLPESRAIEETVVRTFERNQLAVAASSLHSLHNSSALAKATVWPLVS